MLLRMLGTTTSVVLASYGTTGETAMRRTVRTRQAMTRSTTKMHKNAATPITAASHAGKLPAGEADDELAMLLLLITTFDVVDGDAVVVVAAVVVDVVVVVVVAVCVVGAEAQLDMIINGVVMGAQMAAQMIVTGVQQGVDDVKNALNPTPPPAPIGAPIGASVVAPTTGSPDSALTLPPSSSQQQPATTTATSTTSTTTTTIATSPSTTSNVVINNNNMASSSSSSPAGSLPAWLAAVIGVAAFLCIFVVLLVIAWRVRTARRVAVSPVVPYEANATDVVVSNVRSSIYSDAPVAYSDSAYVKSPVPNAPPSETLVYDLAAPSNGLAPNASVRISLAKSQYEQPNDTL